jgi:hypothetical protein
LSRGAPVRDVGLGGVRLGVDSSSSYIRSSGACHIRPSLLFFFGLRSAQQGGIRVAKNWVRGGVLWDGLKDTVKDRFTFTLSHTDVASICRAISSRHICACLLIQTAYESGGLGASITVCYVFEACHLQAHRPSVRGMTCAQPVPLSSNYETEPGAS